MASKNQPYRGDSTARGVQHRRNVQSRQLNQRLLMFPEKPPVNRLERCGRQRLIRIA
jgi:hypothetical protein